MSRLRLPTALLLLGWAETELGDPHAGRRRYEEALELARQSDDHFVFGDAQTQLAWLAADEENWEGALQFTKRRASTIRASVSAPPPPPPNTTWRAPYGSSAAGMRPTS